jgi:cobalamin synthase
MSNLVVNEQLPNPHRTLFVQLLYSVISWHSIMSSSMAGFPMVSALIGIISALSGLAVAAPIVIPIVSCFVLAKWAYDVYEQS